MHFSSRLCTAISLLSVLPSPVLARTPNAAKYEKIQTERRSQMLEAREKQLQQDRPQHGKPANYSYLNPASTPFAVNASALPDVTFDIGENYAGLLPTGNINPVSNETDQLFFWFVPSTNKAASDEIVVFLNGGPGCSSLDGFWHENGPILWQPGTYRPVRNTYSWTNLSNIVWIDQPVGTGYSPGPFKDVSEDDVASDFLGFWRNFVKTFGLQGRKIYLAGESYAGMYAPYIAQAMIEKNDTTYFNVDGMLLFDPSIAYELFSEQAPAKAFVEWNHNVFPFNDSTLAQIANMSSSCGLDDFMETALTFPPSGLVPQVPGSLDDGKYDYENCDIYSLIFNAILELNPCFDVYQITQLCPLLFDSMGFPSTFEYLPDGYDQPYFNHTKVKKILHAPLDVDWVFCAEGDPFIGPDGDTSPPSAITGGPLPKVIEYTNNVVIGHGTLDMVLFANGTLAALQNMTWNGAQGYSQYPSEPFYVPYSDDPYESSMAGAGVMGSWTSERGLTFALVQLSGHMLPEFAPAAAYRQLEVLLGRVGNLSEVSPFTTQPHHTQPNATLDEGISIV